MAYEVIGAAVFSDMQIDFEEINENGFQPPETIFSIQEDLSEKDIDCRYYIDYAEANESVYGNSVEKVVEEISDFLSADPVVLSTGDPVLKMNK